MGLMLLLLGMTFILRGIFMKITKWLWLHQGFYKRNVSDENKYMNYMGNANIIIGICCIFLGFIFIDYDNPIIVFGILFVFYITVISYGEIKYRIKRLNER